MDEAIKAVGWRLPVSLIDEVRAAASAEGRTVEAHVERLIRVGLIVGEDKGRRMIRAAESER